MEAERLLQDLHQKLLAKETSMGVQSSNRTYSEEEDEDEDDTSDEGKLQRS